MCLAHLIIPSAVPLLTRGTAPIRARFVTAACSLMWHESSDPSSAHSLFETSVTISQQRFWPSVGSNIRPAMPSADFCGYIEQPFSCPGTWHIRRPPGVRRVTFLSHTRRIYDGPSPDDMGLCIFMAAYPPATASYTVRVTRTKSLPPPSFRQHITIPPLVFGQEFRAFARDSNSEALPVIKASEETCTLQVTSRFAFANRLSSTGHRRCAPCPAHMKRAPRKATPPVFRSGQSRTCSSWCTSCEAGGETCVPEVP